MRRITAAHKNLMQEILNILQKMHEVRGVIVFRGIAGLDESGQVRASDLLRIVGDLPMVVEFFDAPAKVETVLAALDGLIPERKDRALERALPIKKPRGRASLMALAGLLHRSSTLARHDDCLASEISY